MANLTSITFNYTERDIFNIPVQRSDRLDWGIEATVSAKLVDKLIDKVIRDMRDRFEFDCAMFAFDDGTCEAVWTDSSLAHNNVLMWRHDVSANSSDAPVEVPAAQFRRDIKKRIGLYNK